MLVLVILACAGPLCIPIIAHPDSATELREACLVRLDVMLDIAEEQLMEHAEAVKQNHVLAWDCLPLDLVQKAMALKLPLPLNYHRVIYHDAEGERT